MYSLGFILIAVVDFAVLVRAARLCLRYRTNGLIFASLPLTLLWYDNLVIGIGSTLGEGELLMGPEAEIGAGQPIPPVPAITLTIMMILFGIYLWRRTGWKWLTLGAIGAMAFFAVPFAPAVRLIRRSSGRSA